MIVLYLFTYNVEIGYQTLCQCAILGSNDLQAGSSTAIRGNYQEIRSLLKVKLSKEYSFGRHLKSNPSITCSDELYQSLTNIITEANLPNVYQKTNGTKEKEIPTASKQEQEKIEKAPSADITTSEAAAAATPVTDVPDDSEPKATEEPIIKVEETTTAADVTKENEATNATGPDVTNNTATTTTTV